MSSTSPTVRVWTPNDDPRHNPSALKSPVVATASVPVPTIEPSVAAVAPTPSAELRTIEVGKIKVTIAIESDKLPADILPAVGAPGSAKAQVSFKIKSGDHELAVCLKAKTYRDALAKAQSCPHGAWVVLQGQLGPNNVLEGAGFTVSPITPKPAAPAEIEPVS